MKRYQLTLSSSWSSLVQATYFHGRHILQDLRLKEKKGEERREEWSWTGTASFHIHFTGRILRHPALWDTQAVQSPRDFPAMAFPFRHPKAQRGCIRMRRRVEDEGQKWSAESL